jgi:PIN domain nuclease of toxin-antitoxin system
LIAEAIIAKAKRRLVFSIASVWEIVAELGKTDNF